MLVTCFYREDVLIGTKIIECLGSSFDKRNLWLYLLEDKRYVWLPEEK